MARYLGPKAKLSRREGTDLFLKSARRSISDKAKFDTKPGQHGRTSGSHPDYGLRLRARSRRSSACIGVLEKQFRRYFAGPSAARATPAPRCCRCWNRVWTTSSIAWSFGSTRAEARQPVSHKSITVNGQVVNIPSFMVKAGDVVAVRERPSVRVADALKLADSIGLPGWVAVDIAKMEGTFKKSPDRDEFGAEINESLIVELYSR